MEQETAKINQNFLISVVKYGMMELNQNVLVQVYTLRGFDTKILSKYPEFAKSGKPPSN